MEEELGRSGTTYSTTTVCAVLHPMSRVVLCRTAAAVHLSTNAGLGGEQVVAPVAIELKAADPHGARGAGLPMPLAQQLRHRLCLEGV